MTNEERCFKMTKLERYKGSLDDAKRENVFYTVVMAGVVIAMVLGLKSSEEILQISGLVSTFCTPVALRNMINSICKKTNLESKISDLELDLELGETYSGGRKL